MIKQVTDRIEGVAGDPDLDFTRSYTTAGGHGRCSSPARSTRSRDVPDIWYQARKKIGDIRGTFPAGVVGDPASTTSR